MERMVSLKKYLDDDSQDLPKLWETLLRFAHLLLQGIQLHAIDVDPVEHCRFRMDVKRLSEQLGDKPDPRDTLVIAGGVVRAMENHNRRAGVYIKQQGIEYNRIVGMLTETVATLSTGSEATVSRLHSLQKQLEHAAKVDDLRAVRSQLSQCLDGLQQEKARQRDDAAKVVADLRSSLQASARHMQLVVRDSDVDRCTGLPGRASAERLLDEAFQSGRHYYVALFVVDRVNVINSRFGYAVGDEMLLCFAQHLAQKLSASDHCFRWNGPAFLAIFERNERAPAVRLELQRGVAMKVDKTLTVGSRSVLIPVSVTWTLLELTEETGAPDVTARLDAFVSQQAQAPGFQP